jgi:hypothetical protein
MNKVMYLLVVAILAIAALGLFMKLRTQQSLLAQSLLLEKQGQQERDEKVFIDAGCVARLQGTFDCLETSFAPQFACRALGEISSPFGAPMIACTDNPGSHAIELETHKRDGYFSCRGGSCTSYIYYQGGHFGQVKNIQELISLFGAIRTPQQAKWLVFATQSVESSIVGDEVRAPEIAPTPLFGVFTVVGYSHERFGCIIRPSKKYPVSRVTFNVTADGSITKTSEAVIYEREGVNCID